MSEIAYQSARTGKAVAGGPAGRAVKAKSRADLELISDLEHVKRDIRYVQGCLDMVTDELLIDSYIYEIKALHMKHSYYTRQCKMKGIAADY